MKIFITGGTGFIGRHLVQRLTQGAHELRCLVRKTSNVGNLEKFGVTLLKGDVTDKNSLLDAMQGSDWVINLSNIYSYWEPDNRIYAEINIDGTKNIMECAFETGVSKIVHVSSVVVYGKPTESIFSEKTPVGPMHFSKYARTKYKGDMIAWKLFEKKGLPLVVIYPCGVLGPNDPKSSGQMIQNLISRKLPATAFYDSILTWVHVRDVAEAIVRAIEKKNNSGERYLIGKHQLSMREFYKMVTEISGISLPKIRLPDSVAIFTATILTWLADLIKKPPMWGMSLDLMRTVKEGYRVDGCKAERELGITYTPIHFALEEEITMYQR